MSVFPDIAKVTPHKKLNNKYKNFDLSNEEIEELRSAFQTFEEDHSGYINPQKIISIFEYLGYSKENQNIVNMLDYLNKQTDNNQVNFEAFLEAADKFLGKNTPDKDLEKIYEMFTESKEQPYITLESFKRMLINLGEEMSDEEVQFIFDRNAGVKGYIDFREFKMIFKRKINKN